MHNHVEYRHILLNVLGNFPGRLLAPMERREGEEVPELCGRVQVALAEELQLRRSEVTLEDINRWIEGITESKAHGDL